MNLAWRNLRYCVGPTVLFAAGAVGVSQLIQSTRTGAAFGMDLCWLVVLVSLLKYPFFEFCLRYTTATGDPVLLGYRKISRHMLTALFGVVLVNGVLNIAATAAITGTVLDALAPGTLSPLRWTAVVAGVSAAIVVSGRFAGVQRVTKAMLFFIVLGVLFLFARAIWIEEHVGQALDRPHLWRAAQLGFMLRFMGWMPYPMEGGVFLSLWALRRQEQTGYTPSMPERLAEFKIGYVLLALAALCFMALGALLMPGAESALTLRGGGIFPADMTMAAQEKLGSFSQFTALYVVMGALLLTTLTCLDGYFRTLRSTLRLLIGPKVHTSEPHRRMYWETGLFSAAAVLLIVQWCLYSLASFVITVTTISFATAPLLAYFNYHLVTNPAFPREHQPGKALRLMSWIGLAYLVVFALAYPVSIALGWHH